MSPSKSAKRTSKPKKAAAKRRTAPPKPMEKVNKEQQWGTQTENGEMEHERIQHPWPDAEKQPLGEGETERQQTW